jgi:1-phosphatidylinositol-4-phosphate 5-kinase
MIKKIEHFWKGLSSDRTQISALPPDQYGDRFFNFVEGVTMSREAAQREAQKADQEMQEAVAAETSGHHLGHNKPIPPMPKHQPPVPPNCPRSPEGRVMVEMASKEARRTEMNGSTEQQVPDRTLRTTHLSADGRDSQQDPVLPVVAEAAEGTETRPQAPAKDFYQPPTRAPPPTPPHTKGHLKPESTDSGYAANVDHPLRLKHNMSRDSLNKDLPPLPQEETADSGIRMVA